MRLKLSLTWFTWVNAFLMDVRSQKNLLVLFITAWWESLVSQSVLVITVKSGFKEQDGDHQQLTSFLEGTRDLLVNLKDLKWKLKVRVKSEKRIQREIKITAYIQFKEQQQWKSSSLTVFVSFSTDGHFRSRFFRSLATRAFSVSAACSSIKYLN